MTLTNSMISMEMKTSTMTKIPVWTVHLWDNKSHFLNSKKWLLLNNSKLHPNSPPTLGQALNQLAQTSMQELAELVSLALGWWTLVEVAHNLEELSLVVVPNSVVHSLVQVLEWWAAVVDSAMEAWLLQDQLNSEYQLPINLENLNLQ